MKASSYPVLRNRPIDQWKVTELREELKRRKLITKGLKEDLVKRLNESLCDEMDSNQEDVENGNDDDSQPKSQDNADETTPVANESVSEAPEMVRGVDLVVNVAEDQADGKILEVGDDSQPKGNADETTPLADESVSEASEVDRSVDLVVKDAEDQADGENLKVDNVSGQAVDGDNVKISDQNLGHQAGELSHASPAAKCESVTDEKTVELTHSSPAEKGEPVTDKKSVELSNASVDMSSEAALPGQGPENVHIDNKNSDSRTQMDAEDIKPSDEEVKPTMSHLNNQVSEVNPSLGFPLKNDYVSIDSISINEKNELKDNIIADDVKLESITKHEIMQPSSSPLVPDSGNSHPMDVEESETKDSVDETKTIVKDEDMSKKNSSADLGSPEKFNLDRSPGDDSMEEETLENKQVVSTYDSDEVGGRCEKTDDVTMVKEDTAVDIMGNHLSAAKKDGLGEDMVAFSAITEKRKLLDDQEALTNNEPSKRQRRWKTESVKASEPQSSTPALSSTPRGMPPALVSKRSFSRSNFNANDDAPKERVVPPPSKPQTDSLRIDNFLRPFTLKAVQELLCKTGTVVSFWMDHIKTHCYVTYSSVEEATKTRNAVYNLQWPPNGGRLLAAEFVDAWELKSHVEGPTQPPPPVAAPAAPLQPLPRQLGPKKKQLLQTNLPPPPPLTNPPPVREQLQPPPPPPLEKVEPPVVTLDDLFRKTKTTPLLYYLPLSEEQVKAKVEAQSRNSKAVA